MTSGNGVAEAGTRPRRWLGVALAAGGTAYRAPAPAGAAATAGTVDRGCLGPGTTSDTTG